MFIKIFILYFFEILFLVFRIKRLIWFVDGVKKNGFIYERLINNINIRDKKFSEFILLG